MEERYARKKKSIKAGVAILPSDNIEFKVTDINVEKGMVNTGKKNISSGVFNNDDHPFIYSRSKMYEMPTIFWALF